MLGEDLLSGLTPPETTESLVEIFNPSRGVGDTRFAGVKGMIIRTDFYSNHWDFLSVVFDFWPIEFGGPG